MSAKDIVKAAVVTATMVANLVSDPVDNPKRDYKNYDKVQRNERQWERDRENTAYNRSRDKHGRTK